MEDLQDEQTCPYCKHVVEDYQSNWEEDAEEVTCSKCDKIYTVRAVFQFEGFQMEKQCETCGKWSEDGMALCDCEEIMAAGDEMMDWVQAEKHLYGLVKTYKKAGRASLTALVLTITPLVKRFESGERTANLYASILNHQ